MAIHLFDWFHTFLTYFAFKSEARWEIKLSNMQDEAIPQTEVNHTCTSATFRNPIKQISSLDIGGGALKNILQITLIMTKLVKFEYINEQLVW